jgi:5-oxoprolinase (ATP-hydrolysing) subunit A
MVGQAASSCLAVYRDMGLRAVAEAFADRAYEPDGALRSRKLPGSLLDDPSAAATQAESIVVRGVVGTTSGTELPLAAETLCMHSDTPGAAAIARSVRERLTAAGVQIRPLV